MSHAGACEASLQNKSTTKSRFSKCSANGTMSQAGAWFLLEKSRTRQIITQKQPCSKLTGVSHLWIAISKLIRRYHAKCHQTMFGLTRMPLAKRSLKINFKLAQPCDTGWPPVHLEHRMRNSNFWSHNGWGFRRLRICPHQGRGLLVLAGLVRDHLKTPSAKWETIPHPFSKHGGWRVACCWCCWGMDVIGFWLDFIQYWDSLPYQRKEWMIRSPTSASPSCNCPGHLDCGRWRFRT